MSDETFGERIKSARKRIDMSQADLAENCGIPQGTISRIELGNQESSKFIFKMADVLHCDARWLATGEGVPNFSLPSGMPAADFNQIKKALNKVLTNLLNTNNISQLQADELNTVIKKISNQILKGIARE